MGHNRLDSHSRGSYRSPCILSSKNICVSLDMKTKPVLMTMRDPKDDHTYLVFDLRTFEVHYFDSEYMDKVKEQMKVLRFANLQMCVLLDSIHTYNDELARDMSELEENTKEIL